MYAVEFNANVTDGVIQIPARYKSQFADPHNVKVILMKQEPAPVQKTQHASGTDDGFGALARYADPRLWEQENEAWERAAVEKHEAR